MKKTVFVMIAAALLTFAACSKEQAADQPVAKGIEISATIEQQIDGSTKSALKGTKVVWTTNDSIKVFDTGGNGALFVAGVGGVSNASFNEPTTPVRDDDFDEDDLSCAIYPYNDAVSCSGTEITFTLPATQTYAANSFGQNANVAVGIVSGSSIEFKNVCGVLKLQLKGTYKVSKIELSGNYNEKLNGTYTVDASTHTMSCGTADSDAEKVITLNCPAEGVQLSGSDSTIFCFVIPAGALTKGFTVNVYEKDNETAYTYTVLSTTSDNTISRSIVKKMPVSFILPPAYQKVAYIESTGEQSISTGVMVSEGLTTTFGSESTITSTTDENGEVLLFKGKSGKIDSVIFNDDEEMIHCYIPCYLKSDPTKIGLFDLCWNGKNIYNHEAGYRMGYYGHDYTGQAFTTGFGSVTEIGNFMTTLFSVESGKTYTISIKSTHQWTALDMRGFGMAFFDSDLYMTERVAATNPPYTFTVPDNAVSISMWWQHTDWMNSDKLITLYPQIEAGSVATSYQSFDPFITNSGSGVFYTGADLNR